jgi:opacity protein-like surface antigen
MKHSILLSTVGFLAATTSVHAQDWNADMFAGVAFSGTHEFSNGITRDMNEGPIFGLALSKNNVIAKNLEFGVEFSHQKAEFAGFPNTHGKATSLLATAKYNFVNTGAFEVFAGLGLGATYISIDTALGDAGLAGQVSLGARYAVTSDIKLFAEVRYFTTFGDIEVLTGPTVTTDFDNTTIVAGMRRSF